MSPVTKRKNVQVTIMKEQSNTLCVRCDHNHDIKENVFSQLLGTLLLKVGMGTCLCWEDGSTNPLGQKLRP